MQIEKIYRTVRGGLAALLFILLLTALQRLLEPKYMGRVVEGAFVGEYYGEQTEHELLFLGDCEAYENISPPALWEQYGFTSYIRGSAAQTLAQSYYLLEEMLDHETPRAVVFSVSAMQEPAASAETYNRMTLDGMRMSLYKLRAIQASMLDGEHMVEYLFPLLRYHSRWSSLKSDDFRYYFHREAVSHNGYYLRADIRPLDVLPSERRRSDYTLPEEGWHYLDKMRELCEKKAVQLVLFKAPSLYPTWYNEWDEQIQRYAERWSLPYINTIPLAEEIGIDYSHDSYDGGLHMNVYGAEKLSRYMGNYLKECVKLKDMRDDPLLSSVWNEKLQLYERAKHAQEEEFRTLGYIKKYAEQEEN